jgi:hypothetical protein
VSAYVLSGYELLLVLWGAIWITGGIALMVLSEDENCMRR